MMHHKVIRALCNLTRAHAALGTLGIGGVSVRTLSVALVCGGVAAACAGADTPARDDDLEEAIAQAYANGSGPGPAPVGGSGGRPPAGGSGGQVSRGGSSSTSGAGGAPAGGAGGATAEGGSAGSGSTGDCDPDGLELLLTRCVGSTCHGDGSPFTGFAANEDTLVGFVDENGTASCASAGPLLDPGNPPASIIIQKLKGTATCGQKMPIGPAFTDDEIQCVEDWIGTL
jgi:hypothetical protein